MKYIVMNKKITAIMSGMSAALAMSAQLTVGGYGEATYSYNFYYSTCRT